MEAGTKVPQIAFTNAKSWSVIYPYEVETGLWSHSSMGFVDCPVVNTDEADEKKLATSHSAPPQTSVATRFPRFRSSGRVVRTFMVVPS